MHVLDENVDDEHGRALRGRPVRARKIGKGIGRASMSDEAVIPLLHRLRAVTFFTSDLDYYQPRLCHAGYCLVYLDVKARWIEDMIRRFLRHPAFRTWAQRKGKVIRVTPTGMHVWRLHQDQAELISW